VDRVQGTEPADAARPGADKNSAADVQEEQPAQRLPEDGGYPLAVDAGTQQGPADLQRGQLARRQFGPGRCNYLM
jgi:hypothetical protein